MGNLSFDAALVPVRDDIAEVLPQVWARIGEPGSWLTAEQRVAIAAETRNAADCDLCERRKEALSPYTIDGEHDHRGELPDAWIEVIHRIISDPGRLTEQWFRQVSDDGIAATEYVELLGVVVCVVGIDTYCRGIGMEAVTIPAARAGARLGADAGSGFRRASAEGVLPGQRGKYQARSHLRAGHGAQLLADGQHALYERRTDA